MRAAGRRPKSDRPGRLRTATVAAECGRRGFRRTSSAQTIRATPPGVSVKAPYRSAMRGSPCRFGHGGRLHGTHHVGHPSSSREPGCSASHSGHRKVASCGMAGPFRTPNSHLQHIRVRNSPGCTTAFPCKQHTCCDLDSAPTIRAVRPASTLPTADTISNVTGHGATQPVSMRNAPGAVRHIAARKPVAAQSDRESPIRQAPCPPGTRRARWVGVMTDKKTRRAITRWGSAGAGAVAARTAHRSARRCQCRPKSSASSLM